MLNLMGHNYSITVSFHLYFYLYEINTSVSFHRYMHGYRFRLTKVGAEDMNVEELI